jgi:hypothetical protein
VLKPGDIAPDIDALASDGARFRLSAQATKLCTVVYFFPKAFTPGCTKEARRFRDNYPPGSDLKCTTRKNRNCTDAVRASFPVGLIALGYRPQKRISRRRRIDSSTTTKRNP